MLIPERFYNICNCAKPVMSFIVLMVAAYGSFIESWGTMRYVIFLFAGWMMLWAYSDKDSRRISRLEDKIFGVKTGKLEKLKQEF